MSLTFSLALPACFCTDLANKLPLLSAIIILFVQHFTQIVTKKNHTLKIFRKIRVALISPNTLQFHSRLCTQLAALGYF